MIENNNNKDLVKESKQNQDIAKQIVSKPLKLETVNEGSNEDDVLVRGDDKTVKFVPRNAFQTGGSQNLQQTLDNGSFWMSSDFTKYFSPFSAMSGDANTFIASSARGSGESGAIAAGTLISYVVGTASGGATTSALEVKNGLANLYRRSQGEGNKFISQLRFAEPIGEYTEGGEFDEGAIFEIPAKEAGTYELATTDDIEQKSFNQLLNENGSATVTEEGFQGKYDLGAYYFNVKMEQGSDKYGEMNLVSEGFSLNLFSDNGQTQLMMNPPPVEGGYYSLQLPNNKNGIIAVTDDIPTVDGSETKIVAGENAIVSGNGTTASPYRISAIAISDFVYKVLDNGTSYYIGPNTATGTAPFAGSNSVVIGSNNVKYPRNSSLVSIGANTLAAANTEEMNRSVLVGAEVGNALTQIGDYTTAIGYRALLVSTGFTGQGNTIVGGRAGQKISGTASNNSMLGYLAGVNTTTGEGNVFLGVNAGWHVTTGSGNIIIGNPLNVGGSNKITTGSNNTIIGGSQNLPVANPSNYVVIGTGNSNYTASSGVNRIIIDDTGKTQLLGALKIATVPVYADNAAALAGNLIAGDVYRTSTGQIMIVY